MSQALVRVAAFGLLIAGLAACRTTGPGASTAGEGDRTLQAEVAKGEALYQEGRLTEALIACVDLSRKDPLAPGLPELQKKVMAGLAEQRADAAAARAASTHALMGADVEEHKAMPGTFGVRRQVQGETGSLKNPPSSMEQVLSKKVTVNLDGVSLSEFILAVGASEDVNIVADSMDAAKTMTVHAEDVPLGELLDYISRNLGVTFYVGESMIWATAGDAGQPTAPMDTRMYRLRKGISNVEIDAGDKIKIVDAVERFVPKVEGADLLFDTKAHVLIAKNTRENLSKIEDIIQTLDISPPQVLIEARFMSTQVTDLRELGIDWILNSPIVVSEKNVLQDGVSVNATETQINPSVSGEKIVGFTDFAGQKQGLNLTYQGLLTDPMFQATLHALETSGKARTLSVPKVATVNNRPATIRIGEDFRYFEEYDIESTPSTTDDGQTIYRTTLVPVGTPQLEELGITLDVTPSVGADLSDIDLKIVPEISEFVRYEFYETGMSDSNNNNNNNNNTATNQNSLVKLPIFRRSKIETEVIVQSGETVVMGGLISSSENKTEERVPFLSSIPLLGRLFRHDTVEEKKQNLLIFVTATIQSQRGEQMIPVTPPDTRPASVGPNT